MPPSPRAVSPPDSHRAGLSVGDATGIVAAADEALFRAYVTMVQTAPGPAMLVWGDELVCLAYNRAYRALAGFRVSALGKPLLRMQPELERTFRQRFEQAKSGQTVPLSASDLQAAAGAATMGWLLPVMDGAQAVKGGLLLFIDVTPVIDRVRRVMSAVAGDLRDALVGVRVVTERLARAPKLSVERLGTDLGRVLELTSGMDRMAEDLSTFSRFAGGAGLQVTLRPHDLGVLVRAACEDLAATTEPRAGLLGSEPGPPSTSRPPSSPEGSGAASGPRPTASATTQHPASLPPSKPPSGGLRWSVVELRGAWDADAIRRIVVNLVSVARRYAGEASELRVDLSASLEGGVLSVRGESRGGRDDELAQLLDAAGSGPNADRRRSTANLGFFIARELVVAHAGRLSAERAGTNGFVFRAILPANGAVTPAALPSRH